MRTDALRVILSSLLLIALAGTLSAQVIITEYCNDPFRNSTAAGLDTNADGTAASSLAQSDDEFVEIANLGPASVNIGGWTVSDAVGLRHTFAANTMLPVNAAIVVFGGPNPVMFPNALVAFNALGVGSGVAATTGALGLNNTGDTITIRNSMSVVVDAYTFGNQSGADNGDGESVTRNPETAGAPFNRHSVVSAGVLHSAGLHNDGVAGWASAILPPPVPPMYPGNGTDGAIGVRINGVQSNNALNVHTTNASDALSLTLFSPNGTLVNRPFILAYDVFATGNPPAPILLPGDPMATVWLSIITGRIAIDGFSTSGLPLAPVLGQGGYVLTTTIPVSVGGIGASIIVQLFTLDFGINPVNLGSSHAHELTVN